MSPEVVVALVGLTTALASGIGFFFRGQIRTTNADKLWDVSEGMRKAQAAEILDQRREIAELKARVSVLEVELATVKTERDGLDAQVSRLSHENDRLRDHIDRLTADLKGG